MVRRDWLVSAWRSLGPGRGICFGELSSGWEHLAGACALSLDCSGHATPSLQHWAKRVHECARDLRQRFSNDHRIASGNSWRVFLRIGECIDFQRSDAISDVCVNQQPYKVLLDSRRPVHFETRQLTETTCCFWWINDTAEESRSNVSWKNVSDSCGRTDMKFVANGMQTPVNGLMTSFFFSCGLDALYRSWCHTRYYWRGWSCMQFLESLWKKLRNANMKSMTLQCRISCSLCHHSSID